MALTAVYAGSFDPPTHGHLWMIRTAAALFERLIVAIGVNPDKRYSYPLAQRTAWLRRITADRPNVAVESFENLFLARYAEQVGATIIVRGIRNEGDYTYERGMRNVNADLAPEIQTVFLMPPRELCEVSSSMVKGLIGPAGWRDVVRGYLPDPVYADVAAAHA